MNRNRFETSNCIKPKIASKVEDRLNKSAFFIYDMVILTVLNFDFVIIDSLTSIIISEFKDMFLRLQNSSI